ncbi:MAG: hypothetical protein NT025_07915 [bacterium]|nr:hypothetical protein [bacterium]
MRCTWLPPVIVACMVIGLTTHAKAWDGERKGFVLGIGLGPGYTTFKQKFGSYERDRENKGALVTDFKIGYAPTNQLALYWMSKVSWFSMTYGLDDKVTTTAGTAGLGASYYVQPRAPSAFVCGGIGYSTWSWPFEEDAESWMGLGLTAGGGYEFARYWNVEGNLIWGNPSKDGCETDFVTFKVTVNVLGY